MDGTPRQGGGLFSGQVSLEFEQAATVGAATGRGTRQANGKLPNLKLRRESKQVAKPCTLLRCQFFSRGPFSPYSLLSMLYNFGASTILDTISSSTLLDPW